MWPFSRTRTPCENPRDTLVRYSQAIDAAYYEMTASPAQTTDLTNLIAAIERVNDAQRRGRSRGFINVQVGIAIGLCERYIKLYKIDVPPA